MNIFQKIKLPILYPFLFALYPVLHLYAVNVDKVQFLDAGLILAIVFIATILIFFSFKIFLKDERKTALITAVLVILFFSYNYLFNWISGWKIGIFSTLDNVWIVDWTLGKHVYLILFFSFGLILAFFWLFKTNKRFINLTSILSFAAIVLIVFPVYHIIYYHLFIKKAWINQLNINQKIAKTEINNLPDIYYIILDGHAGKEVLRKYYNLDNQEFEKTLEKSGFYIASESRANYMQTLFSLPSTLNMDYFQCSLPRSEAQANNMLATDSADQLLSKNLVMRELKKIGYFSITFATALDNLEIHESADYFLSPRKSRLSNNFFEMFLSNTPLAFLINKSTYFSPYELHRERILFALETLQEIPKIKIPTFTFTHIMSPHPPFIFDSKGNKIIPEEPINYGDGSDFHGTRKEYIEGYRNQITFLDNKILETIDGILKNSSQSPIIIIQGDHGPGSMLDYKSESNTNLIERSSILNAYHLPNFYNPNLYNKITPVNTFRIIFNQYFDTNYQILEDKSYFSPCSKPIMELNIKSA